jgi:folate-binding protein YgfZ
MTLQAVVLPDRAVLRIEGEDRAEFLQGLITNDIALASPVQAIFAALLSAQGKFQFDFFISADEGGYLMETEKARLPALQRMLTLYKLRSRVTLQPQPQAMVMAILGREAAPALGLPGGEGAAQREGGAVLYTDPRHAPLGVRVIAPDEAAAHRFMEAHGATQAPLEAYETLRIREGIPEGSRDAAIDRTILLENGYDALHGISFSKGCYVGQEITARSKHRATLRKRLCGVSADGDLPPAGTPLMAGSREVGEMRSSCHGQGLALVRLDMLRLAEEPVTAGGLALKVAPLWWHPAENEEASA